MTLGDFAAAVRAYSRETTGSVTSWGRTVAHNKKVGGVATSRHLTFMAVDITYDDKPELDQAVSRAARHGLRLIRESTHDHLQVI